jgi:hypothetical protein
MYEYFSILLLLITIYDTCYYKDDSDDEYDD